MSKNPASQDGVQVAASDATPVEVEAAVQALSDIEGHRLKKVSDLFAGKLRALGLGIGGTDLLQEAIAKTYAGVRHWKKKKVTFVKHLIETMRSIASHAPDELKGAMVVAASAEDALGGLDGIAVSSSIPDPRRMTSAREQLDEIWKTFQDDVEVIFVLEAMVEDKPGPEIQRELGITDTDYETIMRRLRRGLDQKGGWRV